MKDRHHYLGFRAVCLCRTRRLAFGMALFVAACSLMTPGWAETSVTNVIDGVTTNYVGDYTVGTNGPFNVLIVTNGGQLFNANGFIGYSSGASNNAVIVTGPGSVWSNSGDLSVGYADNGNGLSVANGGTVLATNIVIGYGPSTGNFIDVSGGSLHATNAAGGGVLDVRNGSLTLNGGGITANYFYATNNVVGAANSVLGFNSGTLTTLNGAWIVAPQGSNFIMGATAGQAATWNVLGGANSVMPVAGSAFTTVLGGVSGALGVVTVSGTGTVWANGGDLMVGDFGSGSRLTITNGGWVMNGAAYVGFETNANNNAVLVTGVGSVWSNGDVTIGCFGFSNSLTISSGGQVFGSNSYVGSLTNASRGNSVLVTDAGSVWSNNGSLYIGQYGAGNSMTISNGGQVVNGTGYIGFDGEATNNSVWVTGAGSVWNNTNDLYVGWFGANGKLVITNGGQVLDAAGHIGMAGSNNLVLVSGANSLWGNTDPLYVGQSGTNNSLIINNGALVTNGSGWIGYNTNAFNNTVVVTGAGSVWSNYYHLGVGYYGFGNSLTVSNGAQVVNNYGDGNIGYYASASNNSVLVTGSNSVWRNNSGRDLYVGAAGSGNSLTINNGGLVSEGSGYIGWDVTAAGNWAWVAGAGSLWTNSGELVVGYAGAGNSLTISNGGQVVNGPGYLGYAGTASNNTASVTDTGSVWSIGGDLTVGVTGSLNRLTVSNGGQVANNNGVVGFDTNASGNKVFVLGAGSLWTNNGDVTIGGSGSGNSLTISGGGRVVSSNGILGLNVSASNNTVLVSGAGSLWTNSGDVSVGYTGSGNGLTVSNGGQVVGNNGIVGRFASASNNVVLVAGAGSLWTNTGDMTVGYNGSGNSMTVANSGRVVNSGGFIGRYAGSSNNTVFVTGSGSLWSNSGQLAVGYFGSDSGMTISNGGQVANSSGYVGFDAASTNNTVLVTGVGSLWTNTGDLTVGVTGSLNRLTVSNGGRVVNDNGYVGLDTNAFGNTVSVTGTGSVWRNNSKLYVGASGSSNTVMVTVGGQAVSGEGIIGYTASANSNTAQVSGAGATWISGGLSVGYTGSFNQLVITDGGQVLSSSGMVGFAGYSNSAFVAGAGSVWSNGGRLALGVSGGSSWNSLTVTNSGRVFSAGATIGVLGAANSVLVGGTGSVWNNSGNDLVVGNASDSNSLVVTNGGRVLSGNGYIGWDGAATNNSVLVSGAGSVWSNSDSLYVGYTGSFNQLTINDGGTVTATNVVLGYSSSATGNVINIAGGSLYATNAALGGALDVRNGTVTLNSGNMFADHFYVTNNVAGATNSMFNFNGGTLTTKADSRVVTPAGSGFVVGGVAGQAAAWNILGGTNLVTQAGGGAGLLTLGGVVGATGVVTVSGGTLDLNNGQVSVGDSSAGNSLVVTNGGRVLAGSGVIGRSVGADGNVVLVTGTGSAWSITNDLYVGNAGSGNSLSVASGGTVTATNIVVGFGAGVSGNQILLSGGSIYATNAVSGGALDVRNGSLTLNGGQLTANHFYATNNAVGATNSVFNFNSGTLTTLNGSRIVIPSSSNLVVGATAGQTATWNILGGTNSVMPVVGSTSTTIVGGVAGAIGVVTVSGAGTVWTNGGDLSVGEASSFNRLTITNGAQVMSVNGFIGDAVGANSNVVVVAGTNSLWLTSGNLVVGGSGVSNTLIVGSGATVDVRGTFRVGPNAQFLNDGNLLSAATEISSGGQLVVTTGGALGTGAVANSGTLIFNPAGTLTVTNTISGTGNMIENGPGTVVLLSSNAYSGGTLIAGGVMSLKNSWALGSGLVTLSGGLLKADPLVMNFGTYSQSGGTLQMAVGGTTAAGVDYDQVNVAGTATISGGTLKVVPFGAYQPKRGDAVPLIVAAGGLVGTYPAFDATAFNGIASPLLLTNLIYSPTTLTLKWSQLPFSPYTLTPNQQAVARNLDATVNDPRTKAAMDYMDYLPGGVGQMPVALDLISPHQLIPMYTMGFAGAEVQGYNLQARLRDIRGGSTGFSSSGLSFYDPTGTLDGRMGFYDPVGSSGPGPLTHLAGSDASDTERVYKNKPVFRPMQDNPWGVFVSGAGQFVGVQGDHNANGYHVASGGFTVGADYRLMDGTLYPFDQLVIGAALGYDNSSSDIGGGGRINVNGAQGNVYTAWFRDGFHVEGMAGGGYSAYDTRRAALGGTASGNTHGNTLQGLLGTGYDWQVGPWTFGPQVSAQYTRVNLDGFTESDSLLPLRIESQTANSLHSQVGAHLSWKAALGTVLLTPDVHVGWRHEFMNPDIALDSQFANGAGGIFTVRGPALGKDSAVVGIGVSAQLTDDLTTFVNYDTELGRANYQLQYVNAGVRISL